jgi:hypothetical protein
MIMRTCNTRYSALRIMGSVRCDLDDEVGVQCGGDPVEDWDGDDAAGFQARQRVLGHAGSGGQFDMRQAKGEAAFADGAAEQVGALGPARPGRYSSLPRRWLARSS